MYRYCGTYSYTEVLVSTTELILILRSIYWSYRTWTCISDLIHALQSIYLSYGSYTGLTELILVFRILFFCEGTRRYDESEQIRIISQIHYTEITVVTTGLIITLQNLYLFYRYKSTCRYYQTYTYFSIREYP